MKTIFGVLLATLFTTMAHSADITCDGAITMLMADHPSCGGHMAFKTSASESRWMCAKSKEASALLVYAQATERAITVYIDGSGASGCTTLPHYRQVSYMITYP